MIRRLRIKFICINMAIVTLLLCGIFALVLFFTKTNLERESLGMMQSIASDPLRPGRPGETPEGVRLPYFILELDDEGAVVSAEGGYYDLTDEDFLAALASQASGGDVTGILEDYGLRYCRVSIHGKEYIVFADMSSERNVIGSLVRDCLLIGVLSFAAFLAVSFLLARWAVRPVELACEMIYLIDAGVCDSLLYADTASLLPEDVILLDWDKTTGFDIELGGETYSVDMELVEETDEEGSTLYDYAFSLDGEEADFTDVLQQLEALSSTGSAEGVSTALGEEIAFTFHRDSENFAEVELVIYGYDSASCIAVLNGGSALFVPREDVQAIVDAVEALLA